MKNLHESSLFFWQRFFCFLAFFFPTVKRIGKADTRGREGLLYN